MNYLIKELLRHKWRTLAGISGYFIATLFILLVLSVTSTNERDSFGILKGTGTHFIVYIPSSKSCCVSCDSESSDGSLIAEGVYTLMLNSDLLLPSRKLMESGMLLLIFCTGYLMKTYRLKSHWEVLIRPV